MQGCADRPKTFGRGLNAINLRFGVLFLVLTLCITLVAGAANLIFPPMDAIISIPAMSITIAAILIGGMIICILAGKLGERINALTRSAALIAQGNLDTNIDIECACEVGGLADEMRAMQAKLHANFEEMNDLALFDRSTSLPNRRFLMQCLSDRMAQKESELIASGALLYINLNGFKKINDTHGHATGDQLLRACAERILTGALNASIESNRRNAKDRARAGVFPILARFGGDEFAVHVPDSVMVRDLGRVADRVGYLLEQPFQINERCITVSSAIGVSRYPVDGVDADTILRNAGIAMRSAKKLKSRPVRIYGEAMLQEIAATQELESEMREAIELNQFEVYYQPKFAAASETMIGVEALVRWKHPHRGLLAPDAFIELAEVTGLIGELGSIVTKAAVRQCAIFARDRTPIDVAINVSLAQFERDNFAESVLDLIRKFNAPPECLTFEITESLACANVSSIRRQMNKLRLVGVKFAIDDFGTGYSNFAQMLALRFDELKIDRSLISNVCTDTQHAAAVRTIVALGKAIGCRVLAEGVETREQLTRIKALGCDELQGFLFAKPMQIEEFRQWARRRLRLIDTAAAGPSAR